MIKSVEQKSELLFLVYSEEPNTQEPKIIGINLTSTPSKPKE